MRYRRFDWRWIGVIAVLIVLASANRLPWPVVALVLAGSGGYLVYQGWHVWSGSGGGRSGRVVYWRGQRIEMGAGRRPSRPSFRSIGPAAIYLVLGGVLLLAGLALVLQQFGL